MTGAITALAALTGLPALVFGAECIAGLRARHGSERLEAPPPFAVIIPAHDEEGGIATTIAAVREQLRASDRLIVVADNCTDTTAVLAGLAGAEIIIRNCPDFRGKGFALAAGRDVLRLDPPAIAIVLDADCIPDDGALPRLAAMAAGEQAVVQGLYLLEHHRDAGANTAISTFAFLVKNLVRQRGLRSLGGPALLQGTGMAFPWTVFDAARLASGDIVEDRELGIELALAGVPIHFAESACFRSAASGGAALGTQRTRWEHGSVGAAFRFAGRLLAATLQGRAALALLLLDLLVPPLALLSLGLCLVGVIGVGVWYVGGGPALLIASGAEIVTLWVTIALVWRRFGRAVLPFATLIRIPLYILWKLPIYLKLVGRRERRWVRTARETRS